MKSIRSVFLVLVAVFALGAVAASSAFASPEWYVKKSGTYSKVKEAVKVKAAFGLEEIVTPTLYGPPYNEKFGIKCKGTAAGELKSGGISDLTSIRAGSCEKVDGCAALTGNVETIDIPWQLELYKEGTEIRSKFVSGTNGMAGFRFSCKTNFLGPEEVETLLSTSTHMTNLVSGFAEAAFDAKSAKGSWADGGEIEWKGPLLTVEPVEKSGVEAIKVE
jgi:hypothetical protein